MKEISLPPRVLDDIDAFVVKVRRGRIRPVTVAMPAASPPWPASGAAPQAPTTTTTTTTTAAPAAAAAATASSSISIAVALAAVRVHTRALEAVKDIVVVVAAAAAVGVGAAASPRPETRLLLACARDVGERLCRGCAGSSPFHLLLGNVARRVLASLRKACRDFEDELARSSGGEGPGPLFLAAVEKALEEIQLLDAELDSATRELVRRAPTLVRDIDTVATVGCSHSTTNFLVHAARHHRLLAAAASGREQQQQQQQQQQQLQSVAAAAPPAMFRVVILEGAPSTSSAAADVARHVAALRGAGISSVRVLPDASAFAALATCTKVLLGVDGVFADGGLLAPAGSHALCVVAARLAVPVIVVAMTLKMSPALRAADSPSATAAAAAASLAAPGAVLPAGCLHAPGAPSSRGAFAGSLSSSSLPAATALAPAVASPLPAMLPSFGARAAGSSSFHSGGDDAAAALCDVGVAVEATAAEYVPPDLVTVFATNEGEFTGPQIFRLLRDHYHPDDVGICAL